MNFKDITIAVLVIALATFIGLSSALYLQPRQAGFGNIASNMVNRIEGAMTPGTAQVASASSTTILAASTGRQYVTLTNTCASTIFLGFGTTASKGWGTPLFSHQTLEILPEAMIVGSITGIASTSDGTDFCRVSTQQK